MLTKTMKWLSVAILLPALFWQASPDYQLALQLVVCVGAVLVAWEAYRGAREVWAIGFVAIALLFNPFQPFLFSRGLFLVLDLLTIATFLASLLTLKAAPKPQMPSIAD